MSYAPLTRHETASVIEGCSVAPRVPMMVHFWTDPARFGVQERRARDILATYPMDVQTIGIRMPGMYDAPEDDPEYRWMNYSDPDIDCGGAIDSKMAIPDWSLLDAILENWPSPEYPGLIPAGIVSDGRYMLGNFWFCYFERHWSMRGMTNALMDYYTDPESVHRLFRALTDFYLRMMERARHEAGIDGIFTSDDLGTQTGPFFSPEIFREFFLPYYAELFAKAHELDMHFWLHCCGNVEKFIPDWIDAGLDVLHPIQKHTMDDQVIAERFGQNICVWAGLDVQQVIPWGTPEEVRVEIRYLIDTYWRPKEGRLMITAGNGITADCPIESLEAFCDETYHYGLKKVQAHT